MDWGEVEGGRVGGFSSLERDGVVWIGLRGGFVECDLFLVMMFD